MDPHTLALTLQAADRGSAVLREATATLSPRSPMAATMLLAALRRGAEVPMESLIAAWMARASGTSMGDTRYRWDLDHVRYEGATYCGPSKDWMAWRPRDQQALERDPRAFEQRFSVPISIADGGELLAYVSEQETACSANATLLLEEAMRVFPTDLSSHLLLRDIWANTFVLRCLVQRPKVLDRLSPFALAIAASCAARCQAEGPLLLGQVYPFYEMPLVSASAHLGTGLLALGQHLSLLPGLVEAVSGEQQPSGGWGDADGPEDLWTTYAAAALLSQVDPHFDPCPTARFLAERQREDGWWSALGPDAPFLTDSITTWLTSITAPFAHRYRWPHAAEGQRDYKTQLPGFGWFSQVADVLAALPGLADAPMQIAFLDLAGFRAFNNRYGQQMGDAALEAFAEALGQIPHTVAIRDGGDEFLLIGPPTGTDLSVQLDRFRTQWPGRFIKRFGTDAPPVVARALFGNTSGGRLSAAREALGQALTAAKSIDPTQDERGVRVDVDDIPR